MYAYKHCGLRYNVFIYFLWVGIVKSFSLIKVVIFVYEFTYVIAVLRWFQMCSFSINVIVCLLCYQPNYSSINYSSKQINIQEQIGAEREWKNAKIFTTISRWFQLWCQSWRYA